MTANAGSTEYFPRYAAQGIVLSPQGVLLMLIDTKNLLQPKGKTMKKLVLTVMFLMAVVLTGCDNNEAGTDEAPSDAAAKQTTTDTGAAATQTGESDAGEADKTSDGSSAK